MSHNIAGRLEERAARHPGRVAVVEGRGHRRRTVTFGELVDRVRAVSSRLRARGIGRGDRVLIFVPMSGELYVALLGVLHAGAVAVFVDAWAGRRRLEDAVAAASPVGFIGTPRAQLLRLVSRSLRRIRLKLWAGPGPMRLGRGGTPGGGGSRPAGSADSAAELGPEAPALVTFTTGTTGRPKAAVRSHGFLWAQHQVLARHLGLRESDVDMPTLPVFVLNNLALGVPSVIPDFDPRRPAEIDPESVLEQMRAEGVTTTSGSPAFYARLISRGPSPDPASTDSASTDPASTDSASTPTIPVRALFTGGAPVFAPLAERLAAATAGAVHVLYGSTEAEPISALSALALVEAAAEPGALGVCAGEPVPEIDWKVIRPTNDPIVLPPEGWSALEVEPGETGELVVAGAHVLEGYLDDPENEARAKIRDGDRVWHRTGDGARWDGERLWLMGRVSQRVRSGGMVWWSMAAEARALRVPGVAHAAYLGAPEGAAPSGDDRAILCVELESGLCSAAGSAPDRAAFDDRLRAALSPIPVDEIRVLPIPRDPRHASKTDVGRLRALLEEDGAT